MVAPWWRPEPLNEWETQLLGAVFQSHIASTFRQNPSAVAVQLSAQASGDYFKAIAAALMMGGGQHGPLVAAYDLLAHPNPVGEAKARLLGGKLVPGWGNSFVKGAHDPLWDRPRELIQTHPVAKVISEVQVVMDPKHIYPNPSCFTAATAVALGIPRESTPWIALAARLPAWSILFQKAVGPEV